MKFEAPKGCRNKSGMYLIICDQYPDRPYVGRASCLRTRKNYHCDALRDDRHTNQYLQNLWNKYGDEYFLFKTILVCEKDDLEYYDQVIMDLYPCKLNLALISGSRKGMRNSAQSKLKVGNANRGFKNGSAILDEQKVLKIMIDFITTDLNYDNLAQRYDISPRVIADIIRGRYWKHVQPPQDIQERFYKLRGLINKNPRQVLTIRKQCKK